MENRAGGMRLTQAAGDGHPIAFWWQGRRLRVLSLDRVRVRGYERCFRVSTVEGSFELVFDAMREQWRLGRVPGRVERWLARLEYGPRYPLPAWRRRSYRPKPAASPALRDAACQAESAAMLPVRVTT